jgi:HAD superfamily hydrolase (TIGR01484 family)
VAELLMRLLAIRKVVILSGSGFPDIHAQLLQMLPASSENFSNLLLLPTSGTRLYLWKGSWTQEYAEHIAPERKERIIGAVNKSLTLSGYIQPQKIYGQLIEDRGSQITFSGLGQQAPLELKKIWDTTHETRSKIAQSIAQTMPECDVRLGGMTSIDITTRGVNKAYGLRKLEEMLKIQAEEIVFVGDSLFHEGNGYPIRAAGIDCIEVHGPEETEKLIESWLA